MDEQTIKFLNKTFTLAAVLVVGVLVFFVGQIALQSRSLDQQNQNQITVSGVGKVYAKPDVALVSLGVTTQATTVADVTKNNTAQMNAVIQVLKDLKVDEKDIQTTNYSLTPVYNNLKYSQISGMMNLSTQGNTIVGYSLEQNIQVKIRDFAKIGDIISQATAKGSNAVGDLQFTIDKPEQLQQQARALAIADAKSNANNLSKESGIGLGKLINVNEGYSPSPIMYSAKAMGGGVAESAPAPTIQPGQQEIDVTVNLTYQVK